MKNRVAANTDSEREFTVYHVWQNMVWIILCALMLVMNTAVVTAAPPAQSASTPEVTGSVRGQVINGTARGEVPPDLVIRLLVSTGAHTRTFETAVDANGGYLFTGVPVSAANQYAVAARYRERIFSSEVVTGDPAAPDMVLPLTIYELTEDPSVISISSVVTQVNIVGDTMEVRQAFTFNNRSDRLLTSSTEVSTGHFASVAVKLPPGAQVVQLDETGRYVLADDGTTLVDTLPVVPGDGHGLLVIYLIPYDNISAIIEQEINYPLAGEVRLLVWPTTLEIITEQLTSGEAEARTGITYQTFSGSLALIPGDVLRYTLRGAASSAAENMVVTTRSNTVLPILLILIGGAVAVVGSVLFFRGRRPHGEQARQHAIDTLLEQVAELDRLHQSGQLNHDVWHRQRGPLKARLASLMGETDPEDE